MKHLSAGSLLWLFLGLFLIHVVATIHLYLCRGKCVSGVFANDILRDAKSVNLCVAQCFL